jgi:hypothetical protein
VTIFLIGLDEYEPHHVFRYCSTSLTRYLGTEITKSCKYGCTISALPMEQVRIFYHVCLLLFAPNLTVVVDLFAAFVYFGMLPIDSSSQEAKMLINYCNCVLDALEIKNGPTHAEIILTPSGPCLVEMNCRAHGGDGNWRPLARSLTGGYSQVEGTVDAYLDKKAFHILPRIPASPPKAFGQEVILVSYAAGEVKATPGYDVIKNLESFVFLETGVSVGSKVEHTVDLLTCVGSAILVHEDEEVVLRDVKTIRALETNNELFEFALTATPLISSMSVLDFSKLEVADNQ